MAVDKEQTSLTQRYRYEELQHPYNKYADQVSSLMTAYGDILAIQDPTERQTALDKLKGWVSGRAPSQDEIAKLTGPLGNAARAIGFGGVMDVASGTGNLISGGAQIAGGVVNGAMLPIDVIKGLIGFGYDMGNEGLNRQLSKAQAQEIGTAYGSVLQAQAQNHGGWFGSLNDFWVHTRAAAALVWEEYVKPLWGKVTGQASTEPPRSYAEHLQRAYMGNDLHVVRDEFAKVPSIGGISGVTLGSFFAQGGVVQGADGKNLNVTAPTSSNPTPDAAGAVRDANGGYIAPNGNAAGSMADAYGHAKDGLVNRLQARVANIDSVPEVAGLALGAAGVGMAAHGAAGRVAQRHLVQPAEQAAKAEKAAADAVKVLEARITAAEAGKKAHFWSKGPEDVASLRNQLKTAENAWEKAALRAQQLGAPADRVAAAAAHPNSMVRAAGSLASSAEKAQVNWNPLTWPGAIGRGIGRAVSWMSVPAASSVATDVDTAKKAAGWVAGGGLAAAPGHVANAATAPASAVANASKGVVRGAAIATDNQDVVQAAANSGWFGKVGEFLGKWGSRLSWASPAVSSGQTLVAVGEGNNGEAALRGTETAVMATGLAKLGFSRAIPWLSPVVSGTDLTVSAVKGDTRGMIKSSTELGTVGAGAAIGAGIGVWFGGIGAVPGALAGATVGGIASIFTGWGAGKVYDRYQPPASPAQVTARDGALGNADQGIQVALTDQQKQQARLAFASSTVVPSGGTSVQGNVSPTRVVGGIDIDHLRIS